MRSAQILVAGLAVCALVLISCSVSNQAIAGAQKPLTTIPTTPGGIIEYGAVTDASTLPAAMASVLRQVHQACGEKPVVGQVFRPKGSNSAGVFFTVVDHAQGGRQLAGLVIAVQAAPNQMEAAVVSDSANRFGQTANGMMRQLFAAWNPGAPGDMPAVADGGGGALPPVHQVTLPDNTATISLPAEWNIVPSQSGMGITTVAGPQGESLGLNMYYVAQDPYSQSYQNQMRMGIRFAHQIVYPSSADLTKSFADVFQLIRALTGKGPAPLKVDNVQLVSGSQGQCVNATGQLNPDGQAMRDMQMLLCRSTPNQFGMYFFILTKCLLPLGTTDQQRATAAAIIASYKADMQRAQAIANAQSAPIIAQMQQTYQVHQQALMSFTRQQIANIHQIGADVTERMKANQRVNQAQREGFEQHEDNISRQGQGFSNYLLDQSVVQNNNVGGTGIVGHSTQWNSVANAMVQANPSKYEIVNTPNYWQGVDY